MCPANKISIKRPKSQQILFQGVKSGCTWRPQESSFPLPPHSPGSRSPLSKYHRRSDLGGQLGTQALESAHLYVLKEDTIARITRPLIAPTNSQSIGYGKNRPLSGAMIYLDHGAGSPTWWTLTEMTDKALRCYLFPSSRNCQEIQCLSVHGSAGGTQQGAGLKGPPVLANPSPLTSTRGSLHLLDPKHFPIPSWVHVQSLSCVWLLAAPWTIACQTPLLIEFSRQGYWSGVLFPPPGDLPNPGMEPVSLVSPALAGRIFTWEVPPHP